MVYTFLMLNSINMNVAILTYLIARNIRNQFKLKKKKKLIQQ